MNKQAFEKSLQQQVADLPRELQPEKDLWPGIDIALTTQTQQQSSHSDMIPRPEKPSGRANNVVSFGRPHLALAASVLAVAALSWQWLTPESEIGGPQQLVNTLTQQHLQQKSALLASYSDTSAATENWQQQLNELEQAGEAIKAALKEDPDNVALMKMLQHTYQQQIDLIEKVHAPAWNRI